MNARKAPRTDSELIRLIAEKDDSAFTILYERHAVLIFSVALKVLEDREEARDVVQTVLLKILTKAGLYRADKGSPAAWLSTIARNQALDRLRQIKAHRNVRARLNDGISGTSEVPSQEERYGQFADERELLKAAMANLRPAEIQVLDLAYFRGMSQTEISRRLAQPLGSIKARIRRSLCKLRGTLDSKLRPLGCSTGAVWPSSISAGTPACRTGKPYSLLIFRP